MSENPMVKILANRFDKNALKQIAKECDHIVAHFSDDLSEAEQKIFFNAARNINAIIRLQL